MIPFRIVNIVLAVLIFAVTESALAYCPVPLTSASMCCYYAGSNGTTENRTAWSLNGCLADAKATNNLLIIAQDPTVIGSTCSVFIPYTFPPESWPASIINIAESTSTPIAPSVPNGEWRQDFRHIYTAQATLTNRNPPVVVTYPCADYSGHLNWVVPPPAVACEIPDMPAFSAPDACTAELEANNGLPGPTTTCPAVPVMTRLGGEPSFKTKMESISVPYAGPTATIRTTVYNQHLATIWKYHVRHQRLITNPEQWVACAAKRAVVVAEVTTKHGLTYPPAPDSRHLTGRAFDVSKTVIADIKQVGVFIPALLIRSPVSTLNWGGRFRKPDRVHFELNVP